MWMLPLRHAAAGRARWVRCCSPTSIVIDASGAEPYPGEVLVQGNRIRTSRVAASRSAVTRRSRVIDGHGMTLMPGMVEGHCHPSFTGVALPYQLGMIPPEEHTLKTAANAKLLLDCGFTSIYSAASAKPRLDVAVRNAINAGELRGPEDARCQPRAGRDRRARRRAPAASAPRELRADRRRPGRDPAGRAHLHPRGRRQHQAQRLGRRFLPARAGWLHHLLG